MPKILRGKFYLPDEDRNVFLRIEIKKSKIPKAGDGAFAVDAIPAGARGIYRGVRKTSDKTDYLYSWEVYEYDPESGDPINEEVRCYIDAGKPQYANWTRWVNCGSRDRDNNMVAEQKFEKINYVATRDIKPGEELFIDYGPAYREQHLGLKGRY